MSVTFRLLVLIIPQWIYYQGAGGFRDDNGGLDYHIPVDFGDHVEIQYSDDEGTVDDLAVRKSWEFQIGSGKAQESVPKATLNIIHVSVEMAPIAKVSG